MMDVVYVLGNGSKHNDFEIVHSMRSVRKFLTKYRRIIIIGDLPRTEPDVPFHYIPAPDLHSNKQYNSKEKILRAARDKSISERFLLMNDDFYFCAPVDATTFPIYRMGALDAHIAWRKQNPNSYLRCLQNTRDQLNRWSMTTFDFEVHGPMPLVKSKLIEVCQTFEWQGTVMPLLRSLYGNYLKTEGVRAADLKFEGPHATWEILQKLEGRTFFSLGDGGLGKGDLKSYLKDTYPQL